MADASVVFNVIGKDAGVTDTLDKIKGTFKSTGAEGAAAMRVVDHEVNKLDADIKDAKDSLSKLAREFAMASAGAERTSLSRSMKRQSTELRQLVAARDLLPKDDEAEGAGRDLAKAVGRGLKSAAPEIGTQAGKSIATETAKGIESVGPIAAVALTGIAIAAAPTIGALISAAVLGGAGIGGVAGGVMLAAKDTRVQSALAGLQKQAGDVFTHAAEPFIPAVQASIAKASGLITLLRPIFASTFASASTYLKPLTAGLTGFAAQFAVGFAAAVRSAGPVIAVISDRLPGLGAAIGNIFEVAAQHADGAARAIGYILDFVTKAINVFATLVDFLANVYDWVTKIGVALGGDKIAKFLGLFNGVPKTVNDGAAASMGFKSATDAAADAVKKEQDAIAGLIGEMDALADGNLSIFDATTQAKQATLDATKAIRENGHTLDVNTKAGRENRDALSAQAKAANSLIDANNKAGTSASQASKDYYKQRDALVKSAEAAGMSKKKADEFADSVLHIPKAKATAITADTGKAKSGINGVSAALARIPRNITVHIAAVATGVAAASAAIAGARLAGKRAGGGPVSAGLPYLVGEQGPELIMPRNDGNVLTAPETRGILSKGSHNPSLNAARRSPSGGGSAQAVWATASTRPAQIELVGERMVVEFVRKLIRGNNLIGGAIN